VVGLGEVLWDLLPEGKQLGGAPANFAYMSGLLGHRAIVASRTGTDALGQELRERLGSLELETSFVQRDETHRTGAVKVALDDAGQPEYEIERDAAWDFLEWTPQWRDLAAQADAICFGSLAQRSERSRETIRRFLNASRDDAIRLFDVNLRQDFFSANVLSDSFRMATVVKLNHLELPAVMRTLRLPCEDERSGAQRLRHEFGLGLLCVTRGSRGSLLVRKGEFDEHAGYTVVVADLVGAGDAFTAALAHHLLLHSPLSRINEAANRIGAWVASRRGGTPAADASVIGAVR
jgi:fructokinase